MSIKEEHFVKEEDRNVWIFLQVCLLQVFTNIYNKNQLFIRKSPTAAPSPPKPREANLVTE